MVTGNLLLEIYDVLRSAFGHRNWWPAESPFEVMVGAVLTQNTNWRNVEKAIRNLRDAGLLSAGGLARAEVEELQDLLRPAGYYRQKAPRLKRLARWVVEACGPEEGSLAELRRRPLEDLREELVSLKGIGPETADSILLYALGKPVFVIDAYTARVMGRHELIAPDVSYAGAQTYFQDELAADVELFKDFHAQLVEVGKRYCKSRSPRCSECPLHPLLGDPVDPGEGS